MASELVAAGHAGARRYPLGRLSLEYKLFKQQQRTQLHNSAMAMQAAFVGSQSKQGAQQFADFLKRLSE